MAQLQEITMAGSGWNRQAKSGFSLIEALVALLIIIIGFTGLAAAFQNNISKSVSARNQAQAAIIAQSVLSEMSDTDPSDWNFSSMASGYLFNFNGEKVSTTSDAYYQVAVTAQDQNGWWNVNIGVTWTGWKAEQAKSGYDNKSDEYAYILEASVASLYGDESL
jgi:Tfp pilus assembly protein PilV